MLQNKAKCFKMLCRTKAVPRATGFYGLQLKMLSWYLHYINARVFSRAKATPWTTKVPTTEKNYTSQKYS